MHHASKAKRRSPAGDDARRSDERNRQTAPRVEVTAAKLGVFPYAPWPPDGTFLPWNIDASQPNQPSGDLSVVSLKD
jgi:hypothetical protein